MSAAFHWRIRKPQGGRPGAVLNITLKPEPTPSEIFIKEDHAPAARLIFIYFGRQCRGRQHTHQRSNQKSDAVQHFRGCQIQ